MSGVELTVERVRKTYEEGRVVALDDVSLEAAAGEFVAVTGPSGCGKSTLLNLVGALDQPDSGAIWVGGERVDELRDPAEYRAGTIGFVFQFHNLVPVLSAAENVQVPMLGRGRSRSAWTPSVVIATGVPPRRGEAQRSYVVSSILAFSQRPFLIAKPSQSLLK